MALQSINVTEQSAGADPESGKMGTPCWKKLKSKKKEKKVTTIIASSRHTVVCRAAQEAGAQPREYIDRKKENAIFAPP